MVVYSYHMSKIQQKIVMKELVNNGGKLKASMKKAGYSDAYIDSGKIKKTATWNQLLEKYLPDKLLTRTARQGLKATTFKVDNKGQEKKIPDYATRQRYLETTLKMRNKLQDKIDITSNGQIVGFTMINPASK